MNPERHLSNWRRLIALLVGMLSFVPAVAQISVSSNGVATSTYALKLPPGIAGVMPQLSLVYTAGGANGPVGVGWSLQGLSAITRCSTTYAIDGVRRSVNLTTSDRLCWDSQRLIQTDANGVPTDQSGYGASGSEYRTEIDGVARIRAYGTAGGSAANGPQYFRVWTKSGQIMTFGGTADSQPLAQGKTQVVAWLLNRVSDTKGNYIDFIYNYTPNLAWGSGENAGAPRPGMESSLREIRYTGNGSQLPANSVLFEYGDGFGGAGPRLDAQESHHQGSKTVDTRVMQKITTRINGAANTPVTTYRLGYEISPNTRRLRLVTIKECNGSGSRCLPATEFAYSNGPSNVFTPVSNLSFAGVSPLHNATADFGTLLGDFNGDGRTDLIRWSRASPAQNKLLLNNVDATSDSFGFIDTPGFGVTDRQLFDAFGCRFTVAADFNADGITDLLRWAAPGGKSADGATTCPPGEPTLLYFGSPSGVFGAPTDLSSLGLRRTKWELETFPLNPGVRIDKNNPGYNFYIGDYDGDGRPDILSASRINQPDPDTDSVLIVHDNELWRNNGNGNFSAVFAGGGLAQAQIYTYPKNSADVMRDFNADGLADICAGGFFLSRGDGSYEQLTLQAGLCGGGNALALDVNGDRKADTLLPSSTNRLYIALGDGNSFAQDAATTSLGGVALISTATGVPHTFGSAVLDANGDGRSDVLRWSDDPTQNKLYLSDGKGGFVLAPDFNLNQSNGWLKHGDGSVEMYVGDFSGRGVAEILTVGSRVVGGVTTSFDRLYTRSVSGGSLSFAAQPDLLVVVKSPLGARTEARYRSLAEPGSHYSLNRASGSPYPDVLVQPAQPVVERVSTDVGGAYGRTTAEYRYGNLKANLQGRGLLGFASMTTTTQGAESANSASNYITAVTEYRHDHPFIGMPARVRSYAGPRFSTSGTVLKDTTTIYCDRAVKVGVCPETVATASPLKPRKPYAYQSSETAHDLDGTPLPAVTVTNLLDDWLNAGQVTIQTTGAYANAGSRSYVKVSTNTYKPASTGGDNWILGRLERATVANTTPDDPVTDLLPTSYGTAPYASSTQGTAPTALTVSLPSSALSASRSDPGSLSVSTTASAGGGHPPHAYRWMRLTGSVISPASSTTAATTFSGSVAGWNQTITEQFRVTVTDNAGATASSDLTVTFTTPPQPAIAVSVNPGAVVGSRANPGIGVASASVTASGGVGAFGYGWSRVSGSRISVSGGQTASFSADLGWGENLTETFRITVSDAAGGSSTRDVNVTFTTPTALTASISPTAVSGYRYNPGVATATATATASGGTGGFSYVWSRVAGSRVTVSGTQAATFSASLGWSESFTETFRVIATDTAGNAISSDVNVTFTTPAAPSVTISPTALNTSQPAAGAATSSATATATGGSGGFAYSWSRVTGSRITVSGAQAATFSVNLGSGENLTETFRVTATDSAGNSTTRDISVTFTTPVAMSVAIQGANAAAEDYRDRVTATPSGGVAPYTYQWTKLSGNMTVFSGATSSTVVLRPPTNVYCQVVSATMRVVVTDSQGRQVSGTGEAAVYVGARPTRPDECIQ